MRKIQLPCGERALVDNEDFHRLAAYCWHRNSQGYVIYRYVAEDRRRKTVYMHREVLGIEEGIVDHINGNKLDNRRANLREASRAENAQNKGVARGSSRYQGVHYRADRDKWVAEIRVDGRKIHLGYFGTENEAAAAYDSAAATHYGPHARQNFSDIAGSKRPGSKCCSRCGKWKPHDEFSRIGRGTKRREYCGECAK